jgi:hypothetical protein
MTPEACDAEQMPTHPNAKKVSSHGGGKKKGKGKRKSRKKVAKAS